MPGIAQVLALVYPPVMDQQVYSVMAAELEKIALGITTREVPREHMGGAYGRMMPADQVNVHARALYGVKPGQALMGVAPAAEQIGQLPGAHFLPEEMQKSLGEDLNRHVRRHELIHYLRGRQGKLEGAVQPGIRNVLRTGREELAASFGAARRMKSPELKALALAGVPGEALSSVMHNYAPVGGVGKALLGGTLGKALRAARIIK